MYNPRHSFISTTNTTYPSTLSPNPTLNTLPDSTTPASPRHPARLHRSSKRHLRTSASIASLKPIEEDANPQGVRRERKEGDIRGNAIPESLRPSSMASTQAPSRPLSTSVPRTQVTAPIASRPKSAQSPSARQPERLQPKPSTERMQPTSAPKPQPTVTGLGLTMDQPKKIVTQIKPVQAIAQPKRPKPIDVNPKKESMADEWERELIHSARTLHISMPQQQATSGKGQNKGKGSDLEWERAGTWQEDDPIREAEDRSRRDVKGERGVSPSRLRYVG
jgi:hypothetical protein